MSLSLEAIRNRPVGWWLLGDSSPFDDYSGYERNGSTNGTTKAVALVSGAENSTVVSDATPASFESSVFKEGMEDKPFTLEATVRQIKVNSLDSTFQQILGHDGMMDGLVMEGTKVSFRTKHYGYSQQVQSHNAIYYYPLTEEDGTQAVEGSGFASNGTYSGSTLAAHEGPVANTMSPDMGYVSTTGFNPGNHQQLTIVSWFKAEPGDIDSNTSYPSLWGFSGNNWDARFNNPQTITMHTYNELGEWGSVASATFPSPVDDGEWHMLALVWDGLAGNTKAYIDGTLFYNGNFTPDTMPRSFSTGLFIGASSAGGRVWQGGFGQFSVHSKLMTEAELEALQGSAVEGPGGEVAAVYDIQVPKAVHLMGMHTKEKNSLYVNGELVAESEIPEHIRGSAFPNAGGTLYSGQSTGNDKLAVNGIGVYPNVLTADAARRNFVFSRRGLGTDGVPNVFNGFSIPLSKDYENIFLEQVWSEQEDWEKGNFNGAVAQEGLLMPSMSNGTSLASEWLDVFALDFAETTSIYGVSIDWSGLGATVEVSLDGVTWEEVSRGKKIDTVPNGFDPTDTELVIRVTFAGGIVGDESYLDNLVVTGFLGQEQQVDAREVVYVEPAIPENFHEVQEFNDNWGADVSGASIVINEAVDPDDEEAVNPKTVEVWVRQYGTNGLSISVSGTSYVNGVAGSTIRRGEWTLLHVTSSTEILGDITLSGDIQIGQVVVYNEELTAQQVRDIYRAYVGTISSRVGDNSQVALPETGTAAKIYAHDWTIEGAG